MMDTLVSLSPYLLPVAFVAVSCLTTWSPRIKKALPFPEFLEETLKEVSELFMLDLLKPEVLKQDIVVVDSTTHAHVEPGRRAPREIMQFVHMAKNYIIDLASQLYFSVVTSEILYVSNNLSSTVGGGAINGGKLIRAKIKTIVREREKKMLEKNETIRCNSTSPKLDHKVQIELMDSIAETKKGMTGHDLWPRTLRMTDENVESMSELEYSKFLEYVASCNFNNIVTNEVVMKKEEVMEKKVTTKHELLSREVQMTDENVEIMSEDEYSEFLEYVLSCDSDKNGANSIRFELMETRNEKQKGMVENRVTKGREAWSPTLQKIDENVEFMSEVEYLEYLEFVASCAF